MSQFSWADGYCPKVKASVAGSVLKDLSKQHGNFFTAREVVEAARPEDSPLHPAFEWNDAVAADEHRLSQARCMIRSLRIKVERVTDITEPVRYFVNVRPVGSNERGLSPYTPLTHAMRVANIRKQVLSNAFRELEAFRQKYAQFKIFARIREEIDRLLKEWEQFEDEEDEDEDED